MFALGYEKTGLGKRISLVQVSKMGKSTLGLGYIPTKTFWKLGAFFGIFFIAVLILVGIPWIKLWI